MIALLVIGGGVYIYKNKKVVAPAVVDTETQQTNTQTQPVDTQIDTSNLKTYTNTEYGFEFTYPAKSYKLYTYQNNGSSIFGPFKF